MIETEITITVNRKSDIDIIKQKIINEKISCPVYICEYENHYKLNFVSDYEEWELDSAILECFPGYEFTSDLDRGKKEIRLQLSRYQSELSTDDWGRRIENPLNETKYLITKLKQKPEEFFNPHIIILFEDVEQHYYIHLTDGINKTSGEKGFLLLNEFKSDNCTDEVEFFKDKLYNTRLEAFYAGLCKMQTIVNSDFEAFVDTKKKKAREQQKIPRKIIRDFITSCNKSDKEGVLRNLDENIIFEKILKWEVELRTEGVDEFTEYIKSPNEELCGRNLKIRSQWDFNLYGITIGVKYFPVLGDNEKGVVQQYRRMKFIFNGDKIISIIEES